MRCVPVGRSVFSAAWSRRHSTLGTFLRSFRWVHVCQLDRVSRQLLARAWAAGAGPGDSPLTIDFDSTICEIYGMAKEGARHRGYTGARGYHPLVAVAAGTGDVLLARLTRGFLEYSQHRGFIADPARVRHPKGKPKVERGVQYVRERFFKGRDFDGPGSAQGRSGTLVP